MGNIQIASPLYILRRECEQDLAAVLEKLALIGFEGIEFLGFFGHSASEVRRMLDENGLKALGNHVPYRVLTENTEEVLTFHQTVGCRYLTVSEIPVQALASVRPRLDAIAMGAAEKGIRLLYHNHAQELREKTEGQENLAYLMDNTRPETIALEPDLGWIEIGGGDAAWYLQRYADRCPVIHLKDYYAADRSRLAQGQFEFRPTGFGVLNLPGLMPLCLACNPEWFVTDHDLSYGRSSFDDLKLSLEYTKALLALQAE